MVKITEITTKTRNTNKPGGKGRKGKKGGSNKVVVSRGNGLDAAAMAYARLLTNPCYAPLAHPVYAGADAGFLFRADSFSTIGTAATDTSGYLVWTPGYINFNNTGLLVAAGATGLVGLTPGASGVSPGQAFLQANASQYRCVAACLRITYPGAETSRSGRLHYGTVASTTISTAAAAATDTLATAFSAYSRTPADVVEVIWKPAAADMQFTDPNFISSEPIRATKAAIGAAWVGLPAASGVTFHFTAVYEWMPKGGLGVGQNTTGKNPSRNTLDDVVDFVIRNGETFVRNTGANLMTGAMHAVGAVYGQMPSYGTRINNNQRFMT